MKYSRIPGFLFFLLICSLGVFGNIPKKISLDGSWQFAVDPTNKGLKENWKYSIPVNLVHSVTVPHSWNIDPGLEDYVGSAWYQKDFESNSSWKGGDIRLKFNAVYHDAIVFINGKNAGEHFNSGYTSFSFAIDSLINFKGKNTIVVWTNNSYSASTLPYKTSFDWANDGGIIRSVSLEISGKPSIRFVHVSPEFSLETQYGELFVTTKLWETNIEQVDFRFSVREKKTGKTIFSEKRKLHIDHDCFRTHVKLGKIILWHFDHPELYEIETSVLINSTVTDINTSVFGFKKVEIKGDKLYLNGEIVRLPGIEYMPSSNPRYGAAETPLYMDSVVRAMKDLNVCITRFHWQQDDYLLSLMDNYGILVQEEMPWWQNPGNLSPELMATAESQLNENIEAHFNHPSIFSWGISNEVYGNTERDNFVKLRELIKSLDSSRFVTIVSNEIFERKEKDESLICDIPTWNEYIGTWHGKSRDQLDDMFTIIKNAIGNRPLLITENGLCEPRFLGGDARRIDELLFHTKEWYKQEFVVGYIYFCLNDYRTHVGEEGLGKYKIRRHGITDIYLKPKASYSVFKQIASPIEITKVERQDSTSALISIRIKDVIPSYSIRDYSISYLSSDGKEESILLPELQPGGKSEILLKKINSRFLFSIKRPNGMNVLSY